MTKTCTNPKCTQVNPQPLTNFHRSMKGRLGHRPRCKACHRQYQLDNSEALKKYDKIYCAKHAELRAARSRAYYAANTERHKATIKSWRSRNQEKIKAHSLTYYVANRETILAKQREAHRTPEARAKRAAYYLARRAAKKVS